MEEKKKVNILFIKIIIHNIYRHKDNIKIYIYILK